MSELLLPLFPLKVVLFPHMDLPLHIFEERYKKLLGDCLENKTEFGMVLAQDDPETGESGIATTGCTAVVSRVLERYEDGRMDIIVRGSRRFEIIQLNQDEPCLRSKVAFFEDEPGGEVMPEDRRRDQAVLLCDEVLRMIPRKDLPPGVEAPDRDSVRLAYEIIAPLPVALNFRQTLLEMRTEEERLDAVIQHLTQLKGFLAKLTASRVKAGGNGSSNGNGLRVQ